MPAHPLADGLSMRRATVGQGKWGEAPRKLDEAITPAEAERRRAQSMAAAERKALRALEPSRVEQLSAARAMVCLLLSSCVPLRVFVCASSWWLSVAVLPVSGMSAELASWAWSVA